MAVFRVNKDHNYTVMSNHHLRNADLSLKSKGLLSLILSLPDDWNYTTRGLASICKEGTDSIGSALKELERAGYIVRNRLRDSKGKIVDVEYVIYELPHRPDTAAPNEGEPDTAYPYTENPDMDNPGLEKPSQLNKEGSSNQKPKKDLSSTETSSPIPSSPHTPTGTGTDGMRERERYRELILENIEYDILAQDKRLDRDRLDELVELMVDTVCSRREMIRIAGDDYPTEYQIPSAKQYLERVRDVFLFCCFTGLRYSDVYNLRRSDIKADHIEITTIKTADSLTIELNKHSKAILEKYKEVHFENAKALPVISNQKMNDYLKELAELAGIDEPIRETYYKGNERIDEVTPKYALLGTHAGRRTFICNALSLGIPAQVVMKWTGHSDYKAMKPYIDIADDIKANAMSKFNQL